MRTMLTTLAITALFGCGDKKDAAGTQTASADPAGAATAPAGAAAAEAGAAPAGAAGPAADNPAGAVTSAAEAMEKAAAALEAKRPEVEAFAERAERAAAEMEQKAREAEAAAGDPVARARAMAAADGAEGVGAELPADYPIPPPAGTTVIGYADTREEGTRQRTAYFQFKGAHKDFASHFEKALKGKGLSPGVSAVDAGGMRMTTLTVDKPPLRVNILINEESAGSSVAVVDWSETQAGR